MEDDDKIKINQDIADWKLMSTNEIYIGGTCALLYALDFEDYMKGQEIGDYVSLFFIVHGAGRHKKELAVFGKEKIEIAGLGSLPLQYYCCIEPKVTISAIKMYLFKWNETLDSTGEIIKLFLDFPEIALEQLAFSNIKVYHISRMDCMFKNINNIVRSFKYHYRKLQIIKHIVHGQESKNMVFLDYLNMISAAWHNVSSTSISFDLNEHDVLLEKQSLTEWCRNYNVPLCFPSSRPLDDFVYYDNSLQSIKIKEENDEPAAVEAKFSAGVDLNLELGAFQAMKRLLSYLQGEGTDPAVIRSATDLEEHLENEAVSKIDEIFASNNSFNSE